MGQRRQQRCLHGRATRRCSTLQKACYQRVFAPWCETHSWTLLSAITSPVKGTAVFVHGAYSTQGGVLDRSLGKSDWDQARLGSGEVQPDWVPPGSLALAVVCTD